VPANAAARITDNRSFLHRFQSRIFLNAGHMRRAGSFVRLVCGENGFSSPNGSSSSRGAKTYNRWATVGEPAAD
jgi:hypothetical protein